MELHVDRLKVVFHFCQSLFIKFIAPKKSHQFEGVGWLSVQSVDSADQGLETLFSEQELIQCLFR